MMPALSGARRAAWLLGSLVSFSVAALGCNNGSSLASNESPKDSTPPVDTTTPPQDSTPQDTTPPVPPPPQDSIPPDSAAALCGGISGGSSGAPVHEGIAFGPATLPPSKFTSPFGATIYTATDPVCLALHLAAARRVNARLFVSFTGNETHMVDANGFSMTLWKQRVDRFRGVPMDSYVADGTILGHFIMDEPSDPTNWGGKVVTQAEVEEMARYSKEIWPTMPTMIRTWPYYLKGGQYPHLDAIRFHYLDRWKPLEDFLAKNMQDARDLGLAIVGGLNVLNGGAKDSGIPGRADKKFGMNASEIREWGTRFLQEPDLCAFILWEWDDAYFARPDIKAAIDDLAAQARALPVRECRKP
jgi:hypothetical protein